MSNDKSTTSNDLSLDLEDADGNDSSADEAKRSDESDDDSEDAGVDLDLESEEEEDDNTKSEKRELAIEQHAKSWANKITLGKATLKDIPKSQRYLLPNIKALLGTKEVKEEKTASKSSKNEIMTIVRFETLKEKVQKANRTPAQNKILQAEFHLLVEKGFEPDIALKRAIKEAEISLEPEPDMPKIKTGGAPTKSKAKFDGNEDPNKMTRKELAAFRASHPR